MSGLTHVDEAGNAVMVDITEKEVTYRIARAKGGIHMNEAALRAVSEGSAAKGDVLATARIAGIMAAKKTSDIIPLCHPLQITKAMVDFEICAEKGTILCSCEVKLMGRTGAEMEALTGVSAALLTIYDMCKALDKDMVISGIALEEKDGGRSGHYIRKTESAEERNDTNVRPPQKQPEKTGRNKSEKTISIAW